MARERSGAIISSGLVLLVAAGFCAYARASQMGPDRAGRPLTARFISANGLKVGADVELGGVSVGRVTSIVLDPTTYMANVGFTVDRAVNLPANTSISIGSPSLTADMALMVQAGDSPKMLPPNATITDTHEPLSLEQQVSNYIFGNGGLPPDSSAP
ncbi:MlaD family protein [Novacetimonas pomaceti]|uniref:Organic solvent ABC transporter substrate-binding protein n=1 Tax=Novacetimonas pomaceti TaxID=2021998 RepID=A0ABX5P2Z2_9PROT|nr:MlaD family protein [Novacetimonas pomaceti]PYD48095.1 organic solvent ABC transporter substrate-binding protein [Novacetimonas pomaceti]